MAELILTEKEKADPSYLDWDDAAIAKLVRFTAARLVELKEDAEGLHRVTAVSCAMLLVAACVGSNATSLKLDLGAHTHKGVPTGDWRIIIKRTAAPDQL